PSASSRRAHGRRGDAETKEGGSLMLMRNLPMQNRTKALVALTLVSLLAVLAAIAETADKYQVTGPVLEVTDTMIAVQKGKDRWEVARDAGTKVTGDLKKGAKVTIKYRMVATTVDVKAAETKAAPKKKAAGK